jgi:hypothetical protein
MFGESYKLLILQSSSASCHRKMKKEYKILVGNPEGKRPLTDIGVDGRLL